ncbi:MAG TPA: type II secretion system F family protein [Pseudolysinimonas sp.]
MGTLGVLAIAALALGLGLVVFLIFLAIPSPSSETAAPVGPSGSSTLGRVRTLAGGIAASAPRGYVAWLERQIIYAGKTGHWTVGRIFLIKAILIAVGVTLVILAILARTQPIVVGLSVVFLVLLIIGPEVVVNSRADDRQKAMQLALPDTLDQMTIAVEAGLGFDAAMAKAATNGIGPLSEELVRTLQDMSIGRSRQDAYRALEARTKIDDLRRFIRAIVQADSYGIAIADVLRVQASEMRVKRRQRAEAQAMKVPIKIVFPLVFCILPVLFIVLLTPAVLSIIDAFT